MDAGQTGNYITLTTVTPGAVITPLSALTPTFALNSFNYECDITVSVPLGTVALSFVATNALSVTTVGPSPISPTLNIGYFVVTQTM
jgi:hypothetical protein